ncbi:hypothetical protein [Nitrosococcus oceani]|uniref:Copper oxidase n=2 Tax=Nitrosococcus oceani TaxID=1229 RepID=Q3J888_NITOC|nr:hypothetical protein [Nitrosococcus oceani]ABA58958.1 hypothetical protein Noc_2505 [Nitrosococcus oceani ATCC 19707]KFI18757.1 hypothetical protein IB75_13315 [Nitrosococcus oceani C-27]KFI21875.1 hypothetical protein HW44_12835 [Nitrosococcus oceani]GEM18946.1 hypothetical protein NONS58_03110 [Nitrosococcus oceani]
MMGYQLFIFSAALMLSLGAAAVESADGPKQDKLPSEAAAPEHHHHEHPRDVESQEKGRLEPAPEEKASAQVPAADVSTEEESAATEEEPMHHHHHEHGPRTADVKVTAPPQEEEGHIHHEFEHEHHMMDMDAHGMVMNENTDNLPRDCPKLAGDVEITVRAGTKYAKDFPGTVFGYDQHEWKVKPCTRITVTFINEDDIRHQWMVHMLPGYLYPQGMFHLELAGPGRRTGTFIVPSVEKTYFVHCDIAQHTEKGMKAQLKVGSGDQDFPSIPGLTAPNYPDSYQMEASWSVIGSSLGAGAIGLALAMIGLGRLSKKRRESSEQVQNFGPETKQRKRWRL